MYWNGEMKQIKDVIFFPRFQFEIKICEAQIFTFIQYQPDQILVTF